MYESNKFLTIIKFLIPIVIVVIIVIIVIIVINNKKGSSPKNDITNNTNNKNVYYKELDDGTKVNISPKLNEEKIYNGLKFSTFSLFSKDGITYLIAEVTNIQSKDIPNYTNIDITFYDDNGKKLESVMGVIIPLKASESTQLKTSLMFDYSNAYDLKITEHSTKNSAENSARNSAENLTENSARNSTE